MFGMGCLEKSWSSLQLLVGFGNRYGLSTTVKNRDKSLTHLLSNHSLIAAALTGEPHSTYAILRAYKVNVGRVVCRDNAPFTFTIDLVFRERDVFMVNRYANANGYLAQILIRRPLEGHATRRSVYTFHKARQYRTHCRSPMYRAS